MFVMDMKKLVADGYNAGDYARRFRQNWSLNDFEASFFNAFKSDLPAHGEILDLGCGVGVPYDKFLTENGFKLTGVDLSENHIAQARKNAPEGNYHVQDMLSYLQSTPPQHYAAILALYSLFHLPKEEHPEVLRLVHKVLKHRGFFLVTLGTPLTENLFSENFCGAPMAWSGLSVEAYKLLLNEIGFEFVSTAYQTYKGDKENHFWALVRKIS